MKEFYLKNKKFIDNILIAFAISLGLYLFLSYAFRYVAPFVFGRILSLAYNPQVNFFEKQFHIPRWIGTFIAMIIIFGAISIFITFGINKLLAEATLFYYKLPDYLNLLETTINNLRSDLEIALTSLPPFIKEAIDLGNPKWFDVLVGYIQNALPVGNTVNIVKKIPSAFIIIIISFVSSYFFAKDKNFISTSISKVVPVQISEQFLNIKNGLIGALLGYCKAQMILMTFTFTICIIGFTVLKSPYTLLLAVITSFIDALPFFGSGFILWPSALFFALNGEYVHALGYMAMHLCVILMRQVMEPKVLSSQIGLHPLLTLFSMFIGLSFLGVLGMILGPVIAIIIKTILQTRNSNNTDIIKKV